MAVDVVFTEESPWYTNSNTWKRITEYAASRPSGLLQEDYHSHLDALGIDFTFLPDGTAAEVAGWLSTVIESMIAEGKMGRSETDREHAHELIRKLHSEVQARDHRS